MFCHTAQWQDKQPPTQENYYPFFPSWLWLGEEDNLATCLGLGEEDFLTTPHTEGLAIPEDIATGAFVSTLGFKDTTWWISVPRFHSSLLDHCFPITLQKE